MFLEIVPSPAFLIQFDRYETPYFYNFVRIEIEKSIEGVETKIFSYKSATGEYFYAYKVIKNVELPHCTLTHLGQFEEEEFMEGFMKFQKVIGTYDEMKPILFISRNLYIKPIMKYVQESAFPYKIWENETIEFIVKPEQEQLVKMMDIPTLPEGYRLGDAIPSDAVFITSKWKYSAPGEVENTNRKIAFNPSTAVHFHDDLIGFEMVDTAGSLTHQYVVEEHRNKGIGRIIEIDIVKKCLRKGIVVFKAVEKRNKAVVGMSLRSSYWTSSRQPNGSYDYINWVNMRPLKGE